MTVVQKAKEDFIAGDQVEILRWKTYPDPKFGVVERFTSPVEITNPYPIYVRTERGLIGYHPFEIEKIQF